MEQIDIKSYTGIYHVYFSNIIDYGKIVRDGDILVIDRIVADLY